MKLHRLKDYQLGKDGERGLQGPKGDQGPQGLRGPQGPQGERGATGAQGLQGKAGRDGERGSQGLSGGDGHTPDHKWAGTKLSFENPDGTWGKEVDLRGQDGAASSGPVPQSVKYRQVTTNHYRINYRSLINGHNIFGINAGMDTIVYLPEVAHPEHLVVVKNEMASYSVIIAPWKGHLDVNSEGDDILIDELGGRLII